jgi:hypothetical protein
MIAYLSGESNTAFQPILNQQCPLKRQYFLSAVVEICISTIILLISLWKLRNIPENFHLRQELTVLAFTNTLLIILLVVFEVAGLLWISGPAFTRRSMRILYIIIGILNTYISIFHIWFIFRKTDISKSEISSIFKLHHRNIKTFKGMLQELEAILQDKVGFELFEAYLCKEFAAENILFWKQIKEYNQSTSQEKQIEKAKEILENFIFDNSPLCINISYHCREAIVKHLQNQTPSEEELKHIFDSAFNEIMELMTKDSYLRFQSTPEFQSFMKQLNAGPEQQRALLTALEAT